MVRTLQKDSRSQVEAAIKAYDEVVLKHKPLMDEIQRWASQMADKSADQRHAFAELQKLRPAKEKAEKEIDTAEANIIDLGILIERQILDLKAIGTDARRKLMDIYKNDIGPERKTIDVAGGIGSVKITMAEGRAMPVTEDEAKKIRVVLGPEMFNKLYREVKKYHPISGFPSKLKEAINETGRDDKEDFLLEAAKISGAELQGSVRIEFSK